jgi:hypothetical protein
MAMQSKSATSALLAAVSSLVVISFAANAAKLLPLATMKLGENKTTYIFDPNKVTAVAPTYSLTLAPRPV